MNNLEGDNFIKRSRRSDWEQNLAELENLRYQAGEMRRELNEGGLSVEARSELEENLSNTNKAISIVRESMRALSNENAVVVEDSAGQISIEVTDLRTYWSSEYDIKCKELAELLKELESYKSAVPSEASVIRRGKLEADIERLEKEAEQASENFQRLEK